MEIIKSKTSKELGIAVAKLTAQKLNVAIAEKGCPRIILSRGN